MSAEKDPPDAGSDLGRFAAWQTLAPAAASAAGTGGQITAIRGMAVTTTRAITTIRGAIRRPKTATRAAAVLTREPQTRTFIFPKEGYGVAPKRIRTPLTNPAAPS